MWKLKYVRILLIFFFVLFIACTNQEEKKAEHLRKAREYIEKNELKRAEIELRNVIDLDPENDVAFYDLGETYLKLRNEEKAIDFFTQAIAINPDNMKAQLKMGQIFLILNRTKWARKKVMLVLEKNPNDIDVLHLLSGVQIQEKNLDAAIKTLKKAEAIDPNHFKTHLFMAHVFFSKGDLDEAEKAYLKAIAIDSSSKIPYMELTRLYGKKGDWNKVESVLKDMVQAPGRKYKKLHDLARFYESRQKWDQAEKTYKEAAATAPVEDITALMNLGSYYVRRKSYDNALEAMQKASGIKKDDLSILMKIAQLYFDYKKINDAEVLVDKVLEKFKEQVEANFLKGKLYLLKKDFANALERFDVVIKATPENALAYYLKAICLKESVGGKFSGQDLSRAAAAGYADDADAWKRETVKENLLQALELDPGLIFARLNLTELYLRESSPGPARKQIEILLKSSPRNLKVLTLQGSLKILEGDTKGAEAVFKKVLELNSDYAPGHVRLGLVYLQAKQVEDALKSLKKALELDPFQTEALGLIVDIYMRDKKVDEAFNICKEQKGKIAGNRISVARIESLEGNIFMADGDPQKAKQHYEAAIESDPGFLAPHMVLARIYAREKKMSLVISQYETVLRKNPKFIQACMALGVVYEGQGETKMAEKYYRKALKIKSDYVPAANNLAYILAEEGVYIDEACMLAELARKKRPKDAIVMDTLGWIYYLQGRYSVAIDEFKESLAQNPDNALANYHLGWAYYEKKEFEKAREFMGKALKIDPNFKGADEARSIMGK